ncbi:hypothetical protein Fmac_026706 [Flemingia macrophylla]|uniref:Uncharacterized protein n=1 Tax=Flemingia macrophylla TaxID=520843 RepID=A0ABD1LFN8_9FABA
MESQRYHYRVPWLIYEGTTLMAGDTFSISIEFSSYVVSTNIQRLLFLSPPQCIPCHKLFQEGRDFLSTILSRIPLSNEAHEKLSEGLMSDIQEMFVVDEAVPPSTSLESQRREIPLVLEIFRIDDENDVDESDDDDGDQIGEVMEESMECFQMIPASNEAIKTSLKKSTVVPKGLRRFAHGEEFRINALRGGCLALA